MAEYDAFLAERADLSDERLVSLAIHDDRYYEELIERYEGKLHRYITRIVGASYEDAQDVAQEVFIKVYRNLNGFDTSLKFSSWLYRIAHNEAVSHYRKKAVRPTVTMEEETFNNLASEFDLEADLRKKMEGTKLREAINRLDQKYRDVLILRYLEDKDYQEISDILKKPMGSVSSLIIRAKRLLRKEIEQ